MNPVNQSIITHERTLIACQECDALYYGHYLQEGEHITCNQCGHHISSNRKNSQQRAVAFSIAAIFFLILTHVFNFMTLEIGGRVNEVHLIGTIQAFFYNDRPILGFSVTVFILITPILLVAGLLYLLIPILLGGQPPGGIKVCRFIYSVIPWNMLEVFLVGVLVSLIKLESIATVDIGTGFWAMIGLMICITAAFLSIDKQEIWEAVSP